MSHIVNSCPLTKFDGSLLRLHEADEAAVDWLTTYGSQLTIIIILVQRQNFLQAACPSYQTARPCTVSRALKQSSAILLERSVRNRAQATVTINKHTQLLLDKPIMFHRGAGLLQPRRLRPLNGLISHPQEYSQLKLGTAIYVNLCDFLMKLTRSPTVTC